MYVSVLTNFEAASTQVLICNLHSYIERQKAKLKLSTTEKESILLRRQIAEAKILILQLSGDLPAS
jgi:hypothetical protein